MGISRISGRSRLLVAVALGAMAIATPLRAQGGPRQDFTIEASDLSDALKAVSRQSGREIIFSAEAVKRKAAPQIKGSYTPDDAVRALLAGSGLMAEFRKDVVLIRGRSEAPSEVDESSASADILVTGSRIAGAPSPSQTITISRGEMINAGKATLGEVVRDIPQNFTGGQNPAIAGTTPSSSGESVGAGTSINLRGLGQDATLTLLNGSRLASGGARQSVDVSSIPLGAVDRIEIVADGASALYGSDAVAGVANIILRRDFDGVDIGARFGAATDGGLEQQQYHVTAGRSWTQGGFIVAYEYSHETPIEYRQRDYTAQTNTGLILYPWVERHNALLSGHWEVAPALTIALDGLYGSRADRRGYFTSTAAGSPFYNVRYWGKSFSLAPSLTYDAGRWTVTLAGSYGQDHTRYRTTTETPTAVTPILEACYCNAAKSVELRADGPLLSLPAGDLKIAFGGGYRRADFHAFRTIGSTPQNIDVGQDTDFGFGEISLPVISPEQGSALGRSLRLSAALRYEDYPGVDRVATPKFGAIYAPFEGLDIKASWGKSFKAPTLYQQYSDQTAFASAARNYGAAGVPATAVGIQLVGGRPDLQSERATTWSASLAFHPRAVPGLDLEIGYFNIRYRNRVVAPISITSQALTNPAYAALVTTSPTPAQVADALRGKVFLNGLGVPFNAADVFVIVDNRNLNIATQRIQGVDLAARYAMDLGASKLNLSGNLSYLDSTQALNPSQPQTPLSGTIYNPPHVRARGGAVWTIGGLTTSAYVNHIGGLDDTRRAPTVPISGMTTLDLTARYVVSEGTGFLRNIEVALSAQNFLNAAPPTARSIGIYDPPYDSTNYSPVGRFVSFSISKKW